MLADAKPEPISKPFTALILNIAFPRSACSLSNTGSPNPTGQFSITQVITPPILSPAFLVSSISEIISAAVAVSGHRMIFESIAFKSSSR